MGELFVYTFKSGVCLVLFYLFYRLLLSKETFHKFNRISILSILFLSFLIPFCKLSTSEPVEFQKTFIELEELFTIIPTQINEEISELEIISEFNWITGVLVVYITGILFFLFRNIYSIVRILFLIRKSKRQLIDNKYHLIIHTRNIAPFSWMRYIIISQKDLEEEGDKILTHEFAHICRKHSLDLFIAEITILLHWYNPASWLIKQELQNIHEYEADEYVLKKGIDAKQYQLLLIKKAVGSVRFNSLANSFNHSKLKKRITMMLKEKSSPWARLKFLYVIPLAGIAITAFARPELSSKLEEISEVKVNDLTSLLKESLTDNHSFPEKMDGEKTFEESLLPSSANERIKEVISQDSVIENQYVLSDSIYTEFSVKQSEKLAKIKEIEKSLDVSTQIAQYTGAQSDILIMINGKEADSSILSALQAHKIENITVLHGRSAENKYGEKGSNGVVEVTLKPAQKREGRLLRGIKKDSIPSLNRKIRTTFSRDTTSLDKDSKKTYSSSSRRSLANGIRVEKSEVLKIQKGDSIIDHNNFKLTYRKGSVNVRNVDNLDNMKIFVNGENVTLEELGAIDAEKIETIKVETDERAGKKMARLRVIVNSDLIEE